MGRQGSLLLTFLRKGKEKNKYRNLKFDPSGLTFSIILPRKTKRLSVEDEQLFKDWYELKTKDYVFESNDYIKAKQALKASLKKSEYVEKVPDTQNKLTYRILNEDEIKEKKKLKKERKKEENEKEVRFGDTLPSVESGYHSAVDSPPSVNYVDPTKGSFITSKGNELSQACRDLQTNSLLQNNDTTKTAHSTPLTLEGLVMPEPMDDNISVKDPDAVLDATALVGYFLINIQPFVDNLRSKNNFLGNPDYHTPDLHSMEASSENPEYQNTDFPVMQCSSENPEYQNTVLSLIQCSSEYPEYKTPDLHSIESSSKNPEYETPGLHRMECSSDNPGYQTPGLHSLECSSKNPEYQNPLLHSVENSPENPEYETPDLHSIESSSKNPEYETPGLHRMECSSDNPGYQTPGLHSLECSSKNPEYQNPLLHSVESSSENPEYQNTDLHLIECSSENFEYQNSCWYSVEYSSQNPGYQTPVFHSIECLSENSGYQTPVLQSMECSSENPEYQKSALHSITCSSENPEYETPSLNPMESLSENLEYRKSCLHSMKCSSENPEYETPGLNPMKCSSENSEYETPGLNPMKCSSENPEYETPSLNSMESLSKNLEYRKSCLHSMKCLSENPELSSSILEKDNLEENEAMKMWNMLQATNVSDIEINDLIMKKVLALNLNPSLANDENLNNHTLVEKDVFIKNQPIVDNMISANFLPDYPECATPGFDLMESAPEDSDLNNLGLIHNFSAENEKIWKLLKAPNISDEDFNNFIINDTPALNFNPSTANDENFNNYCFEMQKMQEQHRGCQDLLTRELRNKLMEDKSNYNSFEESIPEQISSSQDTIQGDVEGIVSKVKSGFKTIKEYKFTNDQLAIVATI